MFDECLTIVDAQKIDSQNSWFRWSSCVALFGYFEAGSRLGMTSEVVLRLRQWRPRYLEWMRNPENKYELQFTSMFEEYLKRWSAEA